MSRKSFGDRRKTLVWGELYNGFHGASACHALAPSGKQAVLRTRAHSFHVESAKLRILSTGILAALKSYVNSVDGPFGWFCVHN
jgi:hypothetical protein